MTNAIDSHGNVFQPSSGLEGSSELQDHGTKTLCDLLSGNGGLGEDRVDYLASLAYSGVAEHRSIVRNLWFLAATGKLSRKDAVDAYAYLVKHYE